MVTRLELYTQLAEIRDGGFKVEFDDTWVPVFADTEAEARERFNDLCDPEDTGRDIPEITRVSPL